MAAVMIGKSWGYIDKTGTLVIAAQFEKALEFSGGYAPVKSGKGWGFIDTAGKLTITPRFEKVMPFTKAN